MNLLPARIAAVFCERVGGSRTGGSPAGVAGAWRASLMRLPGERIMPGGRGRKGVGPVGVFGGGLLPFCPG